MPMADMKSNTTTRRSALGLGAVFLSGITAAKAAPKAGANPDAKLIAACDRLLAQHAKIDALMDTCHTIADEHRTEAELKRLSGVQLQIETEIERLQPQTFAGAVALAGLVVRLGNKDQDGVLRADSFTEWAGITIAEFLA